ncbi:uncharacterized protein LOC129742929 [Uranotaenia lowii]|uniref:uncharacterized protein LOC129742929 n=1 Tax=Uranotaenia lowii TaxID=190385 RepID=UPI002478B1DA|nr:uncharacterized protein LOC129742929 [Uranotaenia lowii]
MNRNRNQQASAMFVHPGFRVRHPVKSFIRKNGGSKTTQLLSGKKSRPMRARKHNAKTFPTIYYQKVRGLRTKTADLHSALSAADYDVICFTETWLNNTIKDSELTDCYTPYRCDRSETTSRFERGGGVMIGVKNNIRSSSLTEDCATCLEKVVVHLKLQNRSLYISTVYLPPYSTLAHYAQFFACMNEISNITGSEEDVFWLGKFNLPALIWTYDDDLSCYIPISATTESEMLLTESRGMLGLAQINNTDNINGRLLDLVFVSNASICELFECAEPLLRVDQHHTPFVLTLLCYLDLRTQPYEEFRLDFSQCNYAVVNNLIDNTSWSELRCAENITVATDHFYRILINIIRDNTPLKKRANKRESIRPWWNNDLKNCRNRLRKARKIYFALRNEPNKLLLRELERTYKELNSRKFNEYIQRTEQHLKADPKSFWSFIDQRKSSNGIPATASYLDKSTTDPKDAENLFMTVFRSVLSNNLPPSDEAYLNSLPV